MLRNVHPQDVSIEPFKTYKRFQFTNVDSGSGVYGLRGISGSHYNFSTSSAASQSFGVYNSLSASLEKEPYSLGTYYSLPLYYTINNLYYERFSNNPTFFTASDGTFTQATFFKDPKTYITTVGLFNDSNELLAVAKLSQPVLKSYSREALIKVKLDF